MKIGNGILGISGQRSNIGVVNIFIPRVIKLPAPLHSKLFEIRAPNVISGILHEGIMEIMLSSHIKGLLLRK